MPPLPTIDFNSFQKLRTIYEDLVNLQLRLKLTNVQARQLSLVQTKLDETRFWLKDFLEEVEVPGDA